MRTAIPLRMLVPSELNFPGQEKDFPPQYRPPQSVLHGQVWQPEKLPLTLRAYPLCPSLYQHATSPAPPGPIQSRHFYHVLWPFPRFAYHQFSDQRVPLLLPHEQIPPVLRADCQLLEFALFPDLFATPAEWRKPLFTHDGRLESAAQLNVKSRTNLKLPPRVRVLGSD